MPASIDLSPAHLDRIADALGSAVHTPYAPPHVYPMSAPAFTPNPEAARPCVAGPLGIYVHVPFCNYSCNFCFYARRIGDGQAEKERYVEALLRELEWVEPGTPLTQLYVGGGTPTALPADLLDRVLGAVWARLVPAGTLIHTVESSPESLTAEHLAVFAARGIGRVSMGIQTLSDEVLARVNRQHGGSDALRACERLVASGLIVNIDLIYGLPGQTEAMFRHDFAAVAQCGVHSVTAYNLRVNERTSIVQTMGSDDQLSLARLVHWRAFVQATAAELGFVQKTWHTFQRPSDAARRYEDKTGAGNQLGVGLSARSRLGAVIYRNHASQPVYCDRIETGRSPVEETFQLAEEGRKIRFIAQSIGVGKPLEREPYRQAFGPSIDDDYGEALRRLGSVGLITDTGPAIELTPMGRLFYDLVTLAFYPRHIKDWLHARHTAAQARRAP